MKDKCSHYLSEIHGTWINKENEFKYGFQLVEYGRTKGVYELKLIKDGSLFNSETHFYKIWSDNDKYFIEFIGEIHEITNFDSFIETPKMELKDKYGKIVKYLKSKEIIL